MTLDVTFAFFVNIVSWASLIGLVLAMLYWAIRW